MMASKKTKRMLQMGEEIRQFISMLFARGDVSDPRVKGIAIHNVKMSPDLQVARVNYGLSENQLVSEQSKKEVALGLKSVAGFMRYELGQVLKTRYIPQIHFHFDDRFEHSLKLTKIISDVTSARLREEMEASVTTSQNSF